MNVLVAASRGGGLKEMMPNGHLDEAVVKPGGSLRKLTKEALSLLPPPHRNRTTSHVYILAGIPDISEKVSSDDPQYWYMESIFTEEPQSAIQRVKVEIDQCSQAIIRAGAIPIFCTITKFNIRNHNNNFLLIGKTRFLQHSQYYPDMQQRLNIIIDEINDYIMHINQRLGMSTPMCHRAICQRRGSRGGYYIYKWDRLHDGVHGTRQTRQAWANSIKAAIDLNRKENDVDDNFGSPKRSWRQEKRPRLS